MANFDFGWDIAEEHKLYEDWYSKPQIPQYAEGWAVPMSDAVRNDLKAAAALLQEHKINPRPVKSVINYLQNSSPSCFSLNTCFAIAMRRELDKTLGRKIELKYPNPFYSYACYHCLKNDSWFNGYENPDYRNGGGTLSAMFNVVSTHGILYYEDAGDLGTPKSGQHGIELPMSDKQGYSWVQQFMSKSGIETLQNRYSSLAVKNQVKVVRPDDFDDVVLALKAGCTIAYGTTLAMSKNSAGEYITGGSTAHAMALTPNTLEKMSAGYGCGYNDYGTDSLLGDMKFTEMQKQWRRECSGWFIVLATEC